MNINDINKKYNWSEWKPFPNPEKLEYINAPIGLGVYQLKNKKTGEYVLFGNGKNIAHRMTSLLPKPLGQGTRKNEEKREYVLNNIHNIEYRTVACTNEIEAKKIEDELRKLHIHLSNR